MITILTFILLFIFFKVIENIFAKLVHQGL